MPISSPLSIWAGRSSDVPAAIAVQIIKECGINLVNNGPGMPVRHSVPQ